MTDKQKILIVDDKKENLVALRQVLIDADAEIIEATSGDEALAATLSHEFAMAILDVQMPGMSGYELAEHLRGDKKTQIMPIVFVTAAYADEEHRFMGYEAGGIDYLTKPYSPEVMRAKVNVFLKMDLYRRELEMHRGHLETLVTERTMQLNERVKEIECLYAVSSLVAEPCESIDDALKVALDLIPPGWMYPEITAARIVFDGREFASANFKDTAWKLSADIVTSEETVGTMEVCYLEERPELDDGPFLKEERDLVIDIARQLGVMIGRMRAKNTLFVRARIANIFLTIHDDEMYNEVLKVILERMQSPFGVFGYIDEDGGLAIPTMTRQVWGKCQIPDKTIRFPRETWGDSSWPRAIKGEKVIYSNEASTNTPDGHVPILRHIAMPITFKGEAIGIFEVANKETDYTPADIRDLEEIAELVAPILSAKLRQKRAEEEIRAIARFPSENPNPVLRIARDGTLLYINDGGLSLLPEWHLQIGQSAPSMLKNIALNALNSGATQVIDLEHGERIFSFSIAPIADVGYANLYGRDITERKLALAALRESEEKYRLISDNASDWIYLIAPDGAILYTSPSSERMTGYLPADFAANPKLMEEIVHPDDRGIFDGHFKGIAAKASSSIIDFRIITKAGETRWINHSCASITTPEGIYAGRQGINRDIAERKLAEDRLLETLESLRKSVNTTIQVLVSTVEARDPYTAGHQLRSADLARAIATEMGLPQEKVEGIRMAGSIHDIGKISIPAEILSKPTKLTEIELSLVKAHAQRGFEMLKDVESPWPLAEIVYQHHERMDGSGYPRNLKGDDIMIEARILAVSDTVEAMASHRPYRAGLGIDAALNEIEKYKGIFYDNTVAEVCLRLFREKDYQLRL